ncbi:MAG: hypothetical protein PHD80_04095 [Candidatus ainarchaeum sp.]|nr:hypothetical protein [Candidatus ainarchaeum sp.]
MGIYLNCAKTRENLRCKYHLIETNNVGETLSISAKTNGYFKAKREGNDTSDKNVLGGGFVFTTTKITISTTDDISELRESYSGGVACELHIENNNADYIIENMQFKQYIKNTEYMSKPQGKTYILLRLKE